MATAEQAARTVQSRVALGALAGPLFVGVFTAIGPRTDGYDWRRHAVSSLANGRLGWFQRVNFILTGVFYVAAASGLAACPRRIVGSRTVPALVGAAGVGLVGAGVFLTDLAGGFPPSSPEEQRGDASSPTTIKLSLTGTLHNLSSLPVFVGIPLAGLFGALAFARNREYLWAGYSAGSSLVMVASLGRFGATLGRIGGKAGIMQRISIATGFGWLTAVSLRALASTRSIVAAG
jgi:hypothetical protein